MPGEAPSDADLTLLNDATAETPRPVIDPGTWRLARECSADDCYLLFFDTSRSGNRRWCSMERCGNGPRSAPTGREAKPPDR
ncbi:CGNR zinc finger domain-containing protein [Amycolatopsis sp. NPDC051071]|uniref:CGNR zinc finger domain-containing protein n=1 Tax=Amycolatopsis sp. NPDC051071 TaxID=3154637 RepID=UPI00344075FC